MHMTFVPQVILPMLYTGVPKWQEVTLAFAMVVFITTGKQLEFVIDKI